MSNTLERTEVGAKRLGVSRDQFWALCRKGSIPSGVVIKVGRQYRVNMPKLENWIEQGGNLEGGER